MTANRTWAPSPAPGVQPATSISCTGATASPGCSSRASQCSRSVPRKRAHASAVAIFATGAASIASMASRVVGSCANAAHAVDSPPLLWLISFCSIVRSMPTSSMVTARSSMRSGPSSAEQLGRSVASSFGCSAVPSPRRMACTSVSAQALQKYAISRTERRLLTSPSVFSSVHWQQRHGPSIVSCVRAPPLCATSLGLRDAHGSRSSTKFCGARFCTCLSCAGAFASQAADGR